MPFQKVTIEIVVNSDDSELLVQSLDNVLEKIEGEMTVYSASVEAADTAEPENAAEIAAPA